MSILNKIPIWIIHNLIKVKWLTNFRKKLSTKINHRAPNIVGIRVRKFKLKNEFWYKILKRPSWSALIFGLIRLNMIFWGRRLKIWLSRKLFIIEGGFCRIRRKVSKILYLKKSSLLFWHLHRIKKPSKVCTIVWWKLSNRKLEKTCLKIKKMSIFQVLIWYYKTRKRSSKFKPIK